VSLKNFISHSS